MDIKVLIFVVTVTCSNNNLHDTIGGRMWHTMYCIMITKLLLLLSTSMEYNQ